MLITPILQELLKQHLWQAKKILQTVNEENLHFSLNEQTSSVGFLLFHIAEVQLMIGMAVFGKVIHTHKPITLGKAVDIGQGAEFQKTIALVRLAHNFLETEIESVQTDELWDRLVSFPPVGETSARKGFQALMLHSAHHLGQVNQAIRHGKRF